MAADSQSPWDGGRQAGSCAVLAPLHRVRPLLRPGNQFILFCLCSLNAQRPDRAGSQGSYSRCQESGGWGWRREGEGARVFPGRGQPLTSSGKSCRGTGTTVPAAPPNPRRCTPGGSPQGSRHRGRSHAQRPRYTGRGRQASTTATSSSAPRLPASQNQQAGPVARMSTQSPTS